MLNTTNTIIFSKYSFEFFCNGFGGVPDCLPGILPLAILECVTSGINFITKHGC